LVRGDARTRPCGRAGTGEGVARRHRRARRATFGFAAPDRHIPLDHAFGAIDDENALADLYQRLRGEPDLPRLILRLKIEGRLALATHAAFQRRLADLDAAVFHLDVDQTALAARPTQTDLEAIDFDGVLRRSADRLRSVIEDSAALPESRRRAEEALVELYVRVFDLAREEAA
jgi:hypothetical protein